MNEVEELVKAFDAATMRGERCALATVVSVDGSSYRRPGARMLVSETGAGTGTISAGCLEGDVIEHCRGVIQTAEPKLLEYDTASTGEEMAWGLGLGCGGTVRLLVEPLVFPSPYIEALRRSREKRPDARPMTIATVYRCAQSELVPGPASLVVGARLIINEDGHVTHDKVSGRMAAMLVSRPERLRGGCERARDGSVVGNGGHVRPAGLRVRPRRVSFITRAVVFTGDEGAVACRDHAFVLDPGAAASHARRTPGRRTSSEWRTARRPPGRHAPAVGCREPITGDRKPPAGTDGVGAGRSKPLRLDPFRS